MKNDTTGDGSPEDNYISRSTGSQSRKKSGIGQKVTIEPLAVAVHAANQANAVEKQNVVVIGAGPIGNMVAQVLKAKGAKSVLISDISDLRLELAKKCGIDYVVNTKNVNLGDAIFNVFGADKADLIYDCAGNDSSIGQAIRYARKGSQIILVAVFGKMAKVDLAVLNAHELDLNTSMMYRHSDYIEAIALVDADKINLKRLMSNHFPFMDYVQAYEYIETHKESTMKVLIDVHP